MVEEVEAEAGVEAGLLGGEPVLAVRHPASRVLVRPSEKVGSTRVWSLAAYKCFGDMGEAIGWAQEQQKTLMKKHKHVKLVVTNRTERQWRNAMLRLRVGVRAVEQE